MKQISDMWIQVLWKATLCLWFSAPWGLAVTIGILNEGVTMCLEINLFT